MILKTANGSRYVEITNCPFTGLSTAIAFGQGKFIPDEKYLTQSAKALGLYGEKRYIEAALSYDTLFNMNRGLGLQSDQYNAALAWALSGNADKAFFYLNAAIATGKWINLSRMLSEPDLQRLHVDKRWQQLLKAAKSKSEKAALHLNGPWRICLTRYLQGIKRTE